MSSSRETVVKVVDLGVKYTRRSLLRRTEVFWPLREVSFDVSHGEIMGLIGRNGAGKTTLLKVIAAVLAPDRGQVEVEGLAALLALQAGFTPRLSGRDNIMQGGLLLGLRPARVRQITPEIIEFAELADAIDMPVQTYSAGMRARLGFSVAIHANPDIILIDETLSVGDQAFQRKSFAALERMMSDSRDGNSRFAQRRCLEKTV